MQLFREVQVIYVFVCVKLSNLPLFLLTGTVLSRVDQSGSGKHFYHDHLTYMPSHISFKRVLWNFQPAAQILAISIYTVICLFIRFNIGLPEMLDDHKCRITVSSETSRTMDAALISRADFFQTAKWKKSWNFKSHFECEKQLYREQQYLLPRYSIMSVVRVARFLSWNANAAALLRSAEPDMHPRTIGFDKLEN